VLEYDRIFYGAEYFGGNLDEIIQEIELYMMNIDCLFFKINNSLTNTFDFGTICNNKNIIKTSYPISQADDEDEDEEEDEEEEDDNIIDTEDTEYLVNDDTDDIDNHQYDDTIDDEDDNVQQVVTNYITMKLDTYIGKKGIVHKCKVCDYDTSNHSLYTKHLLTQKHKKNILKSKNLDVKPTTDNTLNTLNDNINKLMKRITSLEQTNKQLREENYQFKNKINKDIVTLKKTISLL